MDLEDRLRRDLHERDDHLSPRGTGAAAVRRTASRRRRRHQLTAATATVALVGVGTASVIATRDQGEQAVVESGTAASADQAAVAAPPFDWSVLDEHSAVGDAPAVITASDGTLYALSTAPGAQAPSPDDSYVPPQQTLYASTDGTNWTPRAFEDLWIGSLAEQDGVLYAVGTAPATAAVGGMATVAAWSTDGGSTWQHAPLPVALGASGPSGVSTHLGTVGLATGSSGAVAAATTWADLDVASLLPAGTITGDSWPESNAGGVDVHGPITDLTTVAAEACPAGWTATLVPATDPTSGSGDPTNVDVRAPAVPTPVAVNRDLAIGLSGVGGSQAQCTSPDPGVEPLLVPQPLGVVAHFDWADLGVDPAEGARVGRSRVHVFVAADRRTFEEVSVPFADASDVQLIATGDGYVALTTTFAGADSRQATLAAWRSTDGRTWTPLAAPSLGGVEWVAGAGVVDGALVVVDGNGRMLRSTDGGSWTATDLTSALGDALPAGGQVHIGSVGIGPAGVVMSADVSVAATAAPVTHDGVTLLLTGTTATVLDAASGAVLAEGVPIDRATVVGPVRVDPFAGEITVTDPATGEVRATFGYDELKGAFSEPAFDPGSSLVLTSTDGTHVGVTSLTDLIGGASGYVSWIEVSDRALVNVARTGAGDTGPGERVLLVGTPPR